MLPQRINLAFSTDNDEHMKAYSLIKNQDRGEMTTFVARAVLALEGLDRAKHEDLRTIIREEIQAALKNVSLMTATEQPQDTLDFSDEYSDDDDLTEEEKKEAKAALKEFFNP